MKRRQAIQNIALITSGIALMPACNFENAPVFENVPLERGQWTLIEQLTGAILPKGELEITTPESTPQYVLTMLNDCYGPEDIQQYLAGIKAFQKHLKEKHGSSFAKLDSEQQMAALEGIGNAESTPEELQYFLSTTKRLTVRHFTTSEYFMTNYLDFEFAPARFNGCVAVES